MLDQSASPPADCVDNAADQTIVCIRFQVVASPFLFGVGAWVCVLARVTRCVPLSVPSCLVPALTAAADPPAPIANWSGFYIGPHVGYAWTKPSYTFDTFVGPEHFSHDASDWFIGGHVGVQHQWSRLVAGIELSYSHLHLSDTAESTLLWERFRTIDIEQLFTATARLGYAFDHWLAYVRGGYASASITDTRVFMNGSPGSTTSRTRRRLANWWRAGVHLLTPMGVRPRVQLRETRCRQQDRSGALPDDKPFEYKDVDTDLHTVTARGEASAWA